MSMRRVGELQGRTQGHENACKGAAEADDLTGTEALAGNKDLCADGHHKGGSVEVNDCPGSIGEFQPPIDEEEFPREEQTGGDPPPQGPVPVQNGLPSHNHPEPDQHSGAQRSDGGLQEGRDFRIDDLDDDLL